MEPPTQSVGTESPAPVAVFAFKRPDYLKKTLASLGKCGGLLNREVVIFCDGARENVDGEKEATRVVQELAKKWVSARKGGRVVVSESNIGLRRAITFGVNQLIEEYGRVIVLEDDIIVSPAFLQYMDVSLGRFAEVERIWQVSGYFVPTSNAPIRPGCLSLPGCWGWATWERAWRHYIDDAELLLTRLPESDHHRFNVDGSYNYLDDLRRNAEGKMDTWHVRWYASMFLHNALAIFPGRSLTRNIGFDRRGTHCDSGSMAKTFVSQSLSRQVPDLGAIHEPYGECGVLREQMRRFFEWQNSVWSRTPIHIRLCARLKRIFAG
jgi:hypothetical protein